MYTIIKIFAFVVLGTMIGYRLYPIVNSEDINSVSIKEIPQPEVVKINSYSNDIDVVEANSNQHKIVQPDYLDVVNNDNQTPLQDHYNELFVSNNIIGKSAIGYTRTQEGLINWSLSHKDKLYQIIDENMPSPIASNMKSSITNGNSLLDEPVVQQESIEDDSWAFLMEQDVRAHITQHDLAAGFELLSVSCKQLVCDVVGIEREANSWVKIYRGFYSFPNIRFPSDENKPVNIRRMDKYTTYIYAQIMFNLIKSS